MALLFFLLMGIDFTSADPPSMFLLQRNSSSAVRCLATGFYPNRAEMFWRKDGEEVHEGVEKGEVLPNNDGTFQMTVVLNVSSIPRGDWTKYECVFQLPGIEDIVTKLDAKRSHSLDYFFTISTGITTVPEFVVVGVVDGVEIVYYSSNSTKAEPKQDWMSNVTEDNPDYWESQTSVFMQTQQYLKKEIEDLQRRKQTGGIHVVQMIVQCQWDDGTGKVNRSSHYGYDGEDAGVLNLKEESWVALKPEASNSSQYWNNDNEFMSSLNTFLQECPDWGKKYVNYGRSSLMRTVQLCWLPAGP